MANLREEHGSRIEMAKSQMVRKDQDPRVIVASAVMRIFPGISIQEAAKASRELVLYPSSSTIKISGEDIKVGDLQYQVASAIEYFGSARGKDTQYNQFKQKYGEYAQTLEMRQRIGNLEATRAARAAITGAKSTKVKINSDDISVQDLQFKLAESLELLNSETYSQQEYFDWFRETDEIIKNMTDGLVTEDDLKERNDWLSMSYTREAEMMTCMGLYRSSKSPEAAQKYSELYNKLVKMRQLRSAIRETTQNHVDNPKTVNMAEKEASRKKAQVYRQAIGQFLEKGIKWNLSVAQLQQLKMYHGNDEDFVANYAEYEKALAAAQRKEAAQSPAEKEKYEQQEKMADMDMMNYSYAYDDLLKAKTLRGWSENQSTAAAHSHAEEFLAKTHGQTETKEQVADRIMRLTGRRPPLNNHTKHAFNKEKFYAANKSYIEQRSR